MRAEKAIKSNRRAQFLSPYLAFGMVHPPKRYVVLTENKGFNSQKGDCVRIPHGIKG